MALAICQGTKVAQGEEPRSIRLERREARRITSPNIEKNAEKRKSTDDGDNIREKKASAPTLLLAMGENLETMVEGVGRNDMGDRSTIVFTSDMQPVNI